MEIQLLFAVLTGIAIILLLILRLKINAFIALLVGGIVVGLMAGMDAKTIIETIKNGMGSTLGFVATVVGLGAMFGGILEVSGGAKAIANFMIEKFGINRAPLAMVISGFLIAIPVFFDVAFIILTPMIYALQRKTKKSLLLYAIPLLAGLAITHAFIPPTPGPIAVAEIIGAKLGWVILIGFIVGIPTALVSGLLFGKYIAGKIHIDAPKEIENQTHNTLPNVNIVLLIIGVPILLILLNTVLTSDLFIINNKVVLNSIELIGHPFSALILANFLAWYLLGIRKGYSKDTLFRISSKSLMPAGTIILLTGAGGVFKEMLTQTGAGKLLADSLQEIGIPILVFAFVSAALVRIIQGSATVAMITAAGLVAPLLASSTYSEIQLACLVLAIAAGGSIFSHVNDSGFWLVSQYLGISEKQTFRSWSVMTSLLALTGFVSAAIIFLIQ